MEIGLEIELKDESTESEITRFGSRFAKKSKSKVCKKFRMRRERNPKYNTKLTLSTIINYKIMKQDERLAGKHII